MSRPTAAALACALALAACGAQAKPAAPTRPADLVGLWRTEGSGIAEETYLRLDPDNRAFLFQACGSPFGQWRAVPGGALTVAFVVAAPDCPTIPAADDWGRNTPLWLRSVVAARADDGRPVLLDAAGEQIARLTPVPEAPGEDLPGERIAPPPPTAEQRERLNTALPLPTGLERAQSLNLAGRWVPANGAEGVFVEFDPAGSQLLRDGCNFGRGRWTLGPGGALAVVLSLSFVVSCENTPIADWLQNAVWAAFDAERLVLVDRAGQVRGSLRKA